MVNDSSYQYLVKNKKISNDVYIRHWQHDLIAEAANQYLSLTIVPMQLKTKNGYKLQRI